MRVGEYGESYKPFPGRPTLTPLFIGALALWAGCSLAYSNAYMRNTAVNNALALAALIAAVFCMVLFVCRKTRVMGTLLVAFLVGAGMGMTQASAILNEAEQYDGRYLDSVLIELLQDSKNNGFGETASARIVSGEGPRDAFTIRLGECEPAYCGQRFVCSGSFTQFDYETNDYAWKSGICGQVRVAHKDEASAPMLLGAFFDFRKQAIEAIGSEDESHALLQALVCGYRRNVSGTEMYSAFQACGLAHLVAVSGAHLVIVTGLFASVLGAFRIPRRATVVTLIGIMASYFVVAGMPVSALRAAIMATLGLLAFFGKRRASSQNAIGVGIIGILVFSPSACLSASFTLSALSTIGIVLFAPLLQAWLEKTPLAAIPLISESLSLTLAASLLSQLYACSLFNQFPIISPLANIVCAPLFTPACGLGLGCSLACLLSPEVSSLLGGVASIITTVLNEVVGVLSSIPFACIPFSISTEIALIVSACTAGALWFFWPKRGLKPIVVAAGAAFAVVVSIFGLGITGDQIVMLNVGQGDAILIRSQGETLLVDTGNQDSELLRELAQCGIVHLDSVLITHADDDHCGSIDALKRAVGVDRMLLAHDMLTCTDASAQGLVSESEDTAGKTVALSQGDSFKVGAFTAYVVWPRTFVDDAGNADSLCLLLEHDGDSDGVAESTALLTGDAETDQLAEMITAGSVGHVDVLKVAHHGSRNGMTEQQAGILSPTIALISCGKNNRYGHPHAETLNKLEEQNSAIFRTDLNGRITCTFDGKSISINCVSSLE